MSEATIEPGERSGSVRAPPSKSYTHRALIAGFLARRTYRIRHPSRCEDALATRRGIVALGTSVVGHGTEWRLLPGPEGPPASARIDCRSSGTTLRFLAALGATTRCRL
ncbi:MAG: 3-phosphoshikimate 1-carboxyvinyltransferase, partial [Thermoplasmata archaeon]